MITFQLPPTPTPWAFTEEAAATPAIQLNYEQYRLWAYADDNINTWNALGDYTTVFQWAAVLLLTVVFVVLMIRLIQGLMNSDT